MREKLGPLLWQFPPNFGFDEERFENFFKLLPRDMEQAAKLAKKHTEKVKGRAWTKTDEVRPMRHAVEIRHRGVEREERVERERRRLAVECERPVAA